MPSPPQFIAVSQITMNSIAEVISLLLALKTALSCINKAALSFDDWRKVQLVSSMLTELGVYFDELCE